MQYALVQGNSDLVSFSGCGCGSNCLYGIESPMKEGHLHHGHKFYFVKDYIMKQCPL